MQTNEIKSGTDGDMKHPQSEKWMSYLYREVSRSERMKLAAHLAACGECQAQVKRWQDTLRALDDGKGLAQRPRFRVPSPLLKWGMAAVLTLTIGFGAGRLVSPAAADTRAMRTSLKSEIRSELLTELRQEQDKELAAYKLSAEEKLAQDNKLILAALGKLDADRQTDYASLRKELETVAVLTQDSLQRAQQQIVTLASLSQPETSH
jgi:hypothetical protein